MGKNNLFNQREKLVSTITNIIISVTSIVAIIISTLALLQTLAPANPSLEIIESKPYVSGLSILGFLFIYNGGDGPCVDVTLTYPREKFNWVYFVVNYKISNLLNAEFKNDSTTYPARSFVYLSEDCEEEICQHELGYLAPGEIFPLHYSLLVRNGQSEVVVSCSDQKKSVSVGAKQI